MEQIVPDSSGNLGNTSYQIPPCIHWFLTWNNYPKNWEDYFINNSSIRSYILGKEIGKNGTPHIQGNISFYRKCRPKCSFPDSIHWEKTKKLPNAIGYCSKEQDYIIKGYTLPFRQKIDNLYPWQEAICNILQKEPDDRKIHWIWEPTGCAGKTTFQKYLYGNFPKVVVLAGKGDNMFNGIVKYQEDCGALPEIVLINIPRCVEKVSWNGIESIKDMFFYSGKYEGGMICGKCPHVVIFANTGPPLEVLSQDRWDVYEIINEELSVTPSSSPFL